MGRVSGWMRVCEGRVSGRCGRDVMLLSQSHYTQIDSTSPPTLSYCTRHPHSPPTQVSMAKADAAAVLVSPETTPDIANLVDCLD